MKDCDDIISRFDNIQDLPVSEEMLGAYLEGNLTPLEKIVLQPEFETGIMTELRDNVLNEDIEPVENVNSVDLLNEQIDLAFESLRQFTDFNSNIDNVNHLF